jgi:hypothetical protein
MSAEISALIPDLQPFARELVRASGAAGLMPRVTSTLRTTAEQTRLYRRYESGLQSLPVAPPGTSAHEYGWAFDMIVTPYDALTDVGAYWTSLGGVWGGQFSDPVHFEYPGFKQALAAAGGAGGTYTRQAGGAIYKLIDLLSGFVPWLGEAQLADTVFRALYGHETDAEWYLQHPAEALRDILGL